jgi:hypothetical protein
MSHELGHPKRGEFRLELAESRPYRSGMDRLTGEWTAEGVKGGLIRFYREIAGVELVFPRADRSDRCRVPRLSRRQASADR